jgi:hypothetical protein
VCYTRVTHAAYLQALRLLLLDIYFGCIGNCLKTLYQLCKTRCILKLNKPNLNLNLTFQARHFQVFPDIIVALILAVDSMIFKPFLFTKIYSIIWLSQKCLRYNSYHLLQCRVLLNLRTTQPFEEVLEDLGQVLKMGGAKRMFTLSGQEVRSDSTFLA